MLHLDSSTMAHRFNPDTDIPSLAGKVIFITGGRSQISSPSYRGFTSDCSTGMDADIYQVRLDWALARSSL